MGNCLNHSSSAAAVEEMKTAIADSPTIESSSVTEQSLVSPPPSPLRTKQAECKQDDDEPIISQPVPLQQQSSSQTPTSPPQQQRKQQPQQQPHHQPHHQPPQQKAQIQVKDEEEELSIEQQREQGQNLLRELVSSGAKTGEIDWKSIISLADDLHKKEQRLLNAKQRNRMGRMRRKRRRRRNTANNANDKSRQDDFFEKRRKRREMIRRRKLESVGSFSVNLLLYDGSDEAKSRQEEQPMYASLPDGDCSEPYNSEIDELSRIKIDHEGESYSPSCDELCSIASTPTQAKRETNTARPCTPLPLFLRSSNPPKIAIEGSFLAACSSTNSSFFEEPSNDMNDDSSSNSSSSSTTSNINFGPSSWDDGLITIDEEASVKMW